MLIDIAISINIGAQFLSGDCDRSRAAAAQALHAHMHDA
jgi:hypothetical protein